MRVGPTSDYKSPHLKLPSKGLNVVVEESLGIVPPGNAELGICQVEHPPPGQQKCGSLLAKDQGGHVDQLLECLHHTTKDENDGITVQERRSLLAKGQGGHVDQLLDRLHRAINVETAGGTLHGCWQTKGNARPCSCFNSFYMTSIAHASS